MKPFVGVGKEFLSVSQLLELIAKLATESSYYFWRLTHKVSGIKQQPPLETDFPMLEGQMFNAEYELRWKYKSNGRYDVLFLSIRGENSDFAIVGDTWQTQDRNAHLYSPTETRFPKSFNTVNLDLKQRYFIDSKTATVHFVALTVGNQK
ncbi:MAG TPA: hypothetical protein DEG17_15700 [Cyanobacteria bacterium UBA11149]|nr:hypothetical protein [Cyanobacteria bacterium UBA11367]HBE60798.1 hypothetical protein [Cyanobacteria bacterium UBA11366]HBK66415.1 hypothetical protein [Cyanobacteria bacterium UBA11166]HBR73652.1 hypothetical protein [Cyanobacteria bacterium UBA11159]HBS72203.1 hypothetical protein [Cyanobacteria bacterium UBA11153]HBW90275.1 hypothetical protein [Cyanobacteria bacterium UBA11149]HCA98193.1 hypothetical protein [Cyanobacteria bacterium UBA9226]